MFNLEDKVAFITGGSGGIGKAIATTFTEAGCKCIISGTNQDKLDQISDEIGCENIALDLSDPAALEEKLGELKLNADILVNNAGLNRDGLMMRMSLDHWNQVINVNLTSSFVLSKYFLRDMVRNKYGRIIFMSSVIASSGNFGQANYAASKSAMFGLAKSIAHEYGAKGVTANCITPGFITTPMTDKLPDNLKAAYLDKIPTKRFGKSDEIAALSLFLASEQSGYINGSVLGINGGLYM